MQSPVAFLVIAAALAATPAAAQETPNAAMASLLQALRLPRATQEARSFGVPEQDLRAIFDRAHALRLPAGVLTEVIEVENTSIREHGPVDNFGSFVQARLDQGLRGNDLAAAIRAEHASHGKGKGHLHGQSGHAGEHGDLHGSPKKSDRSKKGESAKGKKGDSH